MRTSRLFTSSNLADFSIRGLPWKALGTPRIREMTQHPGPLRDLAVGMTGTKGQPVQGTTVVRVNLLQP